MQSQETVILWLNRYAENESAVDDTLERISALRSRMESPRAATLTGMPRSGGYDGDLFARGLTQIEELEEKAQALLQTSKTLYREINDAVDQITGKGASHLRCVLRCRYLDCFSWNEVNEILFSRKPDFDDKVETYLRRTFRLHKEALEALQKIVVPDFGVQETTQKEEEKNNGTK